MPTSTGWPTRSHAEWREAVTLARAMLLLDAMRQYGLVEGAPAIDVARRRLERGAPLEQLGGVLGRDRDRFGPAVEDVGENQPRPGAIPVRRVRISRIHHVPLKGHVVEKSH